MTTESRTRRPGKRWPFWVALCVIVLLATMLSIPWEDSPLLYDSRFVVTSPPQMGLPANPTFRDRLFLKWLQIRRRFQKPRPSFISFPPGPTNRWSIHGLLNQCMEVTGVRFLIPKEVAAGTVQFGHTNTLNGAQWATAFTDALLAGPVEWWDSQMKSFRNEPLVLVTNGATVLVLPKEMVREFR